uniref:NUT family member 2D-like n=1 Tax=Jaculus jaculus TaxID=51337 RepID=UPI001E1B0EA1|nr:NUT family member 2D-like [Jaculus jaculus]
MKEEESLQRDLWEWKLANTSEQKKYHEMANKIMEFEHEEKIDMEKLENISGSQCQPSAVPLRQDFPDLQPLRSSRNQERTMDRWKGTNLRNSRKRKCCTQT